MKTELIREWKEESFHLKLYITDVYRDREMLGYEFYHDGKLIFEGEDFGPGAFQAIDSDSTVAALLGFLALQKGDTDAEYFDDYTKEQLQFSEEFGEQLSMYAYDLDNPEEVGG